LNLFGLFEVNLSGRVMGAAGSLASRHGAAGAFFDGVLATILATPCTAPFLAPALGFAFSQPAPVILLIFISIGIGLSLPYVLLSWHPAWLKFLPKPGPWMEKFKVAMGFPMLATAFWLFQLMISHYGQRAWWMGIFLITIALAAWIFGEFVQRGTKHRGLASTVAVVVLLAGYIGILEAMLHWRAVEEPQVVAAKAFHAPKGIDWQPWSSEAVNKARSEGRPVLVDFTAEWCLTCNTIVKPALESAAVRQKIQEINATALLADYTRVPPVITDELKKFGRVGVPLVLVYPKDSAQPPMVYDVVTSGTLIEALNKAGVGM
jgi:thiol:disulfide interchange protein